MDPNVTLSEIRELCDDIRNADVDGRGYGEGMEMARTLEHKITALDEWLTRGGFAPAVWATKA